MLFDLTRGGLWVATFGVPDTNPENLVEAVKRYFPGFDSAGMFFDSVEDEPIEVYLEGQLEGVLTRRVKVPKPLPMFDLFELYGK